jgi:outer membrane lipoprotein-sorting protein
MRVPLGLTLLAGLLALPACLVRKETRVSPVALPPPAREASLEDLVTRINQQNAAVHTMTATVDLEPTAGSVYSGVIKEYHDVKGFILLESPSLIRMIGQAPVVRTDIFDMVSNGEEFRLYIPPKQKFIVGPTGFQRPAKNSLENLRPQHILEALLLPPIEGDREQTFLEEANLELNRYYVVNVVRSGEGSHLELLRRIWFDRASLDLARVQYYEPGGRYTEDVHYADYKQFDGVDYPTHIELIRPIEDYRLTITVIKATFNQPIAPDKFVLKKPPGAQLVNLGEPSKQENPSGQ